MKFLNPLLKLFKKGRSYNYRQNEKHCGILRTDTKYIIGSIGFTDNGGVPLSYKPYFHIPVTAPEEEVVVALLSAFKENKYGIPHPTKWSESTKKYLRSVGFKSLTELHKRAIFCSCYFADGVIKFTPYENRIGERFFAGFQGQEEEVKAEASAADIRAALDRAFDNCE